MTERKTCKHLVSSGRRKLGLCLLGLHLIASPQIALGFSPATGLATRGDMVVRSAGKDIDDEISKQLARAKEILAKSKAKMEQKELAAIDPEKKEKSTAVPFFAAKDASADQDSRKKKVIKAKFEDTGLATFDGDKMVELSESEEWEVRPLNQVFKSEIEDKSTDPFADRDVAASIFNLRKSLQSDDYQKIFDERNRFIGEQ